MKLTIYNLNYQINIKYFYLKFQTFYIHLQTKLRYKSKTIKRIEKALVTNKLIFN